MTHQNKHAENDESADLARSRLRVSDKGVLRWVNGRRAGMDAGHMTAYGYVRIRIGGRLYMAHRIVWLLTQGCWPLMDIDHINGSPRDNRPENLRETTIHANLQNQRKAHSQSTTGLLGVVVDKSRKNQFRACLRAHGKRYWLGDYPVPELAHAAYLLAKRQLHEGCTL